MDDYMFNFHLEECKTVDETTSYVEILNYTDPKFNICEQHPLTPDEFENFLHRRGAFESPEGMKPNTKLLSGIRLVVQLNAKDNNTFSPRTISLPKESYGSMVRTMRLPCRGIETSAVVGPFFWSCLDEGNEDDDSHLQIIHRKSDVRKKGKTRGWEMLLSHSFRTHITSGYLKGTPSSDVGRALEHLKACASQGEIAHPLLLPTIILSYDLSPDNDKKQREARDWLRRLENAVSLRNEVEETERYFQDGLLEIDGLSRDLVECHGHVMWKSPKAFLALSTEMEKGMNMFWARRRKWTTSVAAEEQVEDDVKEMLRVQDRAIEKLHTSMLSRLDFYKCKLHGLESYIHTTLERLKVQREALYNIMSQREARLNLEIAGEQRRIAHASKRDSTAMKTISLLGAIFLPGNLLASVFGMTFFNFEDETQPVSVTLWIYFAFTIPITAAIVGMWLWFDRRREEQYIREDADLERDIDKMEKDIMFHLRKRTMSKAHTWNTVTSPVKA